MEVKKNEGKLYFWLGTNHLMFAGGGYIFFPLQNRIFFPELNENKFKNRTVSWIKH